MNDIIRFPYSSEAYDQMYAVMRQVQTDTTYVDDLKQYGEIEHWAYPRGKGDCEDYALAMMALLRRKGWPLASMDMGVCLYNGVGHATVICHTTEGDWILDNIQSKPMRFDLLRGYKWIEMSTGGKFGADDWVEIKAA